MSHDLKGHMQLRKTTGWSGVTEIGNSQVKLSYKFVNRYLTYSNQQRCRKAKELKNSSN